MQNKYEESSPLDIEAKPASTFPADIVDYIDRLPEPERAICHALLLDQETQTALAKRFSLSIRRIGKLARTALAPLAKEYGIEVHQNKKKRR